MQSSFLRSSQGHQGAVARRPPLPRMSNSEGETRNALDIIIYGRAKNIELQSHFKLFNLTKISKLKQKRLWHLFITDS